MVAQALHRGSHEAPASFEGLRGPPPVAPRGVHGVLHRAVGTRVDAETSGVIRREGLVERAALQHRRVVEGPQERLIRDRQPLLTSLDPSRPIHLGPRRIRVG